MNVFFQNFLEEPSSDMVANNAWSWTPEKSEAKEIYASGAKTSTSQSTYASEKDTNSDSDRPNEGMLIAA